MGKFTDLEGNFVINLPQLFRPFDYFDSGVFMQLIGTTRVALMTTVCCTNDNIFKGINANPAYKMGSFSFLPVFKMRALSIIGP